MAPARSLLIATVATLAGFSAAPAPAQSPAPVPPNPCLLTVGSPYTLEVVRGTLSCPRARRVMRRYLARDRSPSGWRCRHARRAEQWDAQCRRRSGPRPRPLVRAYGWID